MPDWIVVAGVKPYDGRYELDLDGAPLTTREWGWIKRHAGYLPATLGQDTFTDPEMITILAVIAMRRSGTVETGQVGEVFDRFIDAPFGSAITFEAGQTDAGEDDVGPPPTGTAASSSSNGDDSSSDSETLVLPPSRTGSPASATSASVPVTSAS